VGGQQTKKTLDPEFLKCWRHRVKVRRPSNIKSSRAQVSPTDICAFFESPTWREYLPGTFSTTMKSPPNKDDLGAEEDFLGPELSSKQVVNHSEFGSSV
jgi:hypothetical protein